LAYKTTGVFGWKSHDLTEILPAKKGVINDGRRDLVVVDGYAVVHFVTTKSLTPKIFYKTGHPDHQPRPTIIQQMNKQEG